MILFTNKKQTWNIFKGLTAVFHNRLDFAEVYKSATDVLKHFEVDVLPKIVIYKRTKNDDGELEVRSKEYEGVKRFKELEKFLTHFALEVPSVPEKEEATYVAEDVVKEEPKSYQLNKQNADSLVFEEKRIVIVEVSKGKPHPLFE